MQGILDCIMLLTMFVYEQQLIGYTKIILLLLNKYLNLT